MSRVGIIREKLADFDADAVLVTHVPDIRWATGFTGSNAILFVDRRSARLLTDGRYTTQAKDEARGVYVSVSDNGLLEFLDEAGWLGELRRVVVQADHLSVSQFEKLQEMGKATSFRQETDFLAREIAVKELHEVEAVERAQRLTCDVFEHLLDSIKPGVSEREIAAEVTYQHLRRGCSAMAFDPIVASGPRSALPHARPSNAELRSGEPLLLDFGGVLDGYCSDFTRTVFLGSPAEEQEAVYRAVLDAQEAAFEVIRTGAEGSAVDGSARQSLIEAGYGDAFTHSTGHGVGLEVHEWPRLAKTSEDVLPAGATVTIEPGVYIPDAFGVRIEDVVVVEEEGCRNLTPATKDLLVL